MLLLTSPLPNSSVPVQVSIWSPILSLLLPLFRPTVCWDCRQKQMSPKGYSPYWHTVAILSPAASVHRYNTLRPWSPSNVPKDTGHTQDYGSDHGPSQLALLPQFENKRWRQKGTQGLHTRVQPSCSAPPVGRGWTQQGGERGMMRMVIREDRPETHGQRGDTPSLNTKRAKFHQPGGGEFPV